MNEVVEKPWRWKSGESGNPLGRPKGSRNAFSAAFVGDLQASWVQHGPGVLEKVAAQDPGRYLGICASIIPKDVALTVEQRLPGPLSPQDMEIFQAIRQQSLAPTIGNPARWAVPSISLAPCAIKGVDYCA